MLHFLTFLQMGFGNGNVALFANRLALGTFFAISGYHKLFNRERHATVVATLKACGVPFLAFNQWFVPCVEFFGGLSVLSGILAPLAAMGLICICLTACMTDGRKRVVGYKPIDSADKLDDYLYLPELLYIIGLAFIVTFGPVGGTI